MSIESSKYRSVMEAYNSLGEADTLHRSPASVVQGGLNSVGALDDEGTLDGRINLRGRASAVRDREVSDASHFDNLAKCLGYSEETLERLAKDLDAEGEWSAATDARNLLDSVREIADNAEFELKRLRRDVGRPYSVGDRFSGKRLGDKVGHIGY